MAYLWLSSPPWAGFHLDSVFPSTKIKCHLPILWQNPVKTQLWQSNEALKHAEKVMRGSDQIPSVQPACIQVPEGSVWLWFWGDKEGVNHSAVEKGFSTACPGSQQLFGVPTGPPE